MPIAILNLGGVRGEEAFFQSLPIGQEGEAGVRVDMGTDKVLPGLVGLLKDSGYARFHRRDATPATDVVQHTNSRTFKDMLS